MFKLTPLDLDNLSTFPLDIKVDNDRKLLNELVMEMNGSCNCEHSPCILPTTSITEAANLADCVTKEAVKRRYFICGSANRVLDEMDPIGLDEFGLGNTLCNIGIANIAHVALYSIHDEERREALQLYITFMEILTSQHEVKCHKKWINRFSTIITWTFGLGIGLILSKSLI